MGILTNLHSHRRDSSGSHSMYFSYLIWKLALSFPVAKRYPCFTTLETPKSIHTSSTRVSVDDSCAAVWWVSRSL